MILTVTPNPALDLSGVVEHITPDEKNYVFDETKFPGGNAINVARWLSKMHVPMCASGFLGGGVGKEVKALLEKEGVRHNFVSIEGDTRTSITVSNLRTHQQTRVSFPGPKIHRGEVQKLKQRVERLSKGSLLVIGGSLPPGFSIKNVNQMIRQMEQRGVPVLLDVPGHLLKDARLKNLWLIKPNLTEFRELTGTRSKKLPAIIKQARALAEEVKFVCVSSVDGGALLVHKDAVWFGKPPKIHVKSTVGAGDSMVAAMAEEMWKLNLGKSPENLDVLMPSLLKKSLGAAAATLCTPGTALGSLRQMRTYANRVAVQRLN